MSISSKVVIMTNDELLDYRDEWFNKGVSRGRFEERCDQFQAKEPEANAGSAATDVLRPVEGSSRSVGGRSPTATSERMGVTAGETAPSQTPGAVADPVAYRYRWKIDGEWTSWRVSSRSQKVEGYLPSLEEIPLYTRPAPSDDAIREALADAKAELQYLEARVDLKPRRRANTRELIQRLAALALQSPAEKEG